MITLLSVAAGFFISLFLTYCIIPPISALAHRYNIIDAPDGRLKVHKQPTPYMGGVALFCGIALTVAIIFPHDLIMLPSMVGIGIGCFVLLIVGLVDDIYAISPFQKFFGQLIAAACFLHAGFYLRELFFSSLFNRLFSCLWLVTIINAFNLIDIMDGLATTTALAITTCFCVIALAYGEIYLALLLSICMGALAAFLYYNSPPAMIYLGDAGSLCIGGFIGSLPFLFPWGTYTPYGFLAPITILFVPLAELGMLILIRTYKGIPFYRGSPDHFALYFKRAGWSISAILIYVAITTLLVGGVAFCFAFAYISLFAYSLLFTVSVTLWLVILARNAQRNQSKKD